MEKYKVLITALVFIGESHCSSDKKDNIEIFTHPYKSLETFETGVDQLKIYDDLHILTFSKDEYSVSTSFIKNENRFIITLNKEINIVSRYINPKISFTMNKNLYHGRGRLEYNSFFEVPYCNFAFTLSASNRINFLEDQCSIYCYRFEFMNFKEFGRKVFGLELEDSINLTH